MITCHNWPPRFPQGLCYVLSCRRYLRWWLWSLQEVTQFPWPLPHMQDIHVIQLLFLSWYFGFHDGEGRLNQEPKGQREIVFPPIRMQRKNTQQWTGVKSQPLKDRDKCSMHVAKWKNAVWRGWVQYDPIDDILGTANLHRCEKRSWGGEFELILQMDSC